MNKLFKSIQKNNSLTRSERLNEPDPQRESNKLLKDYNEKRQKLKKNRCLVK